MKIIDPHLHLFDLALGDYTWLKADQPPFWSDKHRINKNFGLNDISLPAPFEHSGFVHIEAGFNNQKPWREVEWLEKSIHKNNSLESQTTEQQHCIAQKLKTIASINLLLPSSEFEALIHKLSGYQSIAGFRHILDDQALVLLQNKQVQLNLKHLSTTEYIFECQLEGTDTAAIDQLCELLEKTPQLKVVLNHAGFPSLMDSSFVIWQTNMSKLAKLANLYIKASGWEMINRQYQSSQIESIVRILIGEFSIDRVMLASNFPLCLFKHSYIQLWQIYSKLAFSAHQKNALMYQNAKRLYQL